MTSLVPLSTCLEQALANLPRVASRNGDLVKGSVLAEDLCFASDFPTRPVALRAGIALASLDVMGASAQMPLAITGAKEVQPDDTLSLRCDAVLPRDAVDCTTDPPLALREAQPGEGMRRAGHDARRGYVIARAGERLGARGVLVARLAGVTSGVFCRPRVQVALTDPDQARFVTDWAIAQGAEIVHDAPDFLLRPETSHNPKLALAPGDTGWLSREGGTLVMDVPRRFDAMLAVLLGLGLPALATLTGRAGAPCRLTLARKITSTIGMTDLVLLRPDSEGWIPYAPGMVTLAALAQSRAFALIAPESEGHAAGARLPAFPLDPDQDSV